MVQERPKYVSRGGFKLEKALDAFDTDIRNRVVLDVGASTGGFTDCLLQHGAKFVYAVDVGYGQLAWKLRTHPQVQSIEKTNIRYFTSALLNKREDFISIAVVDVSFISLRTVLPSIIKILTEQNSCQTMVSDGFHYDIIALLKPQFEAGKAHVKKGGIVPDEQVHIETIDNLSTFVTEKLSATVKGLTYSPIHKDIGNIEYLLWLTINLDTQANTSGKAVQPKQPIAEIVAEAHDFFRNGYQLRRFGQVF